MKKENLLKKDKRSLYKLAEKYFHRYIVLRDINKRGHCITCSKPIEDAGHFNHGGNNKYAYWCDFNEENLNGQCRQCNLFRSGNLNIYAQEIKKIYSPDKIDELNALTWKSEVWTVLDLVDIIEKYKKLCKTLDKKNK